MSKISNERVKDVANVARIAITEEEAAKLTEEFEAILSFAEELNELASENVQPTTHAVSQINVMRDDTPNDGLTQEEVFKNAPDHQYGHFKVPSIIE